MSPVSWFRGLTVGLLGVGFALTSPSRAAPEPKPAFLQVELEHGQVGSRLYASNLKQASIEPGGLEITASAAPEWLLLGLKPGDVIVAENGTPVGERLFIGDGTHVLDVRRAGKPLMIRVIVHPAARRTRILEEERFEKLVEQVREVDPRSVPVKTAAGPSGVRIIDTLLGLYMDTEVGDLIRTIDGVAIHSDAQLSAAIENLRVGNTDIVLDRGGRTITLTLTRKAPLDLTQIKQLGSTRFAVSRAFADAVFADTDILARKLTATPRIKNGRPQGFAIYEIKPDAPAAKLGFQDGDIVIDVDGHAIDTSDQVSDARSELESASSLSVHLERKGKPVTLTYSITP